MKTISATIVADSVGPYGDRITTYSLTFPRFILAELNTHRMFSRNSASSRAIPFEKMLKMVEEDPFIPIAWQKDHKGMQGTEYFDPNQSFRVEDFLESLKTLSDKIDVTLYHRIIGKYSDLSMTLPAWWLFTRDKVLEASILLNVFGVTKQICNRLLEPFMWHTALITSTEWENFFKLRCPKYQTPVSRTVEPQRSWNDLLAVHSNPANEKLITDNKYNWSFKMQYSLSSAEIHIQALAEAMWDARNKSTPKKLQAGEWHIPFGDNIQESKLHGTVWTKLIPPEKKDLEFCKVKIATARCARLSYMTFDGEIDYEKDIQLHDRLLADGHMSPFEHCARAMNNEEYESFIKGNVDIGFDIPKETQGWCNNFKGFIPYRYLIENN